LGQATQLRYGENPHQDAVFRPFLRGGGQPTLQEVAVNGDRSRPSNMSFNNYVDADSALELCRELTRAKLSKCVSAIVKHTNPCGCAITDDEVAAFSKAYLGDPHAALGGILAVSFPVTEEIANTVMNSLQLMGKGAGANGFFIEVWIAPRFDDRAVKTIRTAKRWGERVRLIEARPPHNEEPREKRDYKIITDGLLIRTRDLEGLSESAWSVVTSKRPNDKQIRDLRLAWLICKHTKSNAVSICKDGMLIGNGAGQMSRVMSCRIAAWLAKENAHEEKLHGAAAASDGFFPFRDGPDVLADAGVSAIIQPGGSKRDQKVIDACNERGLAMIFTDTRHFKH